MKRERGRPPVYADATQQPVLVAVRVPRAIEQRLREEAAEQGHTMTSILLKALMFRWEHAHAAAELTEAQAQLATLQRQYMALERKSARLTQRRRSQAATDKKERTRLTHELAELTDELAEAEARVRLMHERMVVFTAQNPELAEENARRYAHVQREAHRRRMAELQEEMKRNIAEMTGRAPASSVPVRALEKLCHPDRWSQGQPATDLAHEVMVLLNR